MSSDKKIIIFIQVVNMETDLVDEMTRIVEAVAFLWSPLFPVH